MVSPSTSIVAPLRARAPGLGDLETLAALEDWRPDVVVLDSMMPRIDGWTLRAEQRARVLAADLPLVV